MNRGRKLVKKTKHSLAASGEKGPLTGELRRSSARRAGKFFVAFFVCSLLLITVAGVSAYFLFFGKNSSDSTLVARIDEALDDLVGDEFDVQLNDLDVGVSWDGKAGLTASNVKIVRRSDNVSLAQINSMRVVSSLTDALSGNPGFELVEVSGARLNVDVLGSNNSFILPPHFKEPLNATGAIFDRLHKDMQTQGFERFAINDLAIEGTVFGRKQKDPVLVNRLLVEPVAGDAFQMTAKIFTENSDIDLVSNYQRGEDGRAAYEFKAVGLSLLEWLPNPDERKGFVSSDSILDVAGRIGFRDDTTALDPIINLKAGPGTLRIGPNQITDVKNIDLNFHFIIERDQIELDPSEIEIGGLTATLVGGIKPDQEAIGYAGPLLYDIIMQNGKFTPPLEGEPVVPAGFKLAGVYDRENRQLDMNRILLKTESGTVSGSGSFGFTGETPSLVAQVETKGISVLALKQFWPFFMAEGARDWIHKNVIGGDVVSGTLKADIPAGIIFKLKQGAKMQPEHFKVALDVENFSFTSFGEMPPIKNGKGQLFLEGMKISAKINAGQVVEKVQKPLKVRSGSFVINDFGAQEKIGSVNLKLDGDATAMAQISNLKPLRVMERLKVDAQQFSGKANLDLASVFPIRKGIKYEEVQWNALLDLRNAASSKPIAERKFSSANITIDANPKSATIIGDAKIDGIAAEVKFIEPIGKSNAVERSRVISATLDDKARKSLGFNFDPVVKGPVAVTIKENVNDRDVSIDFQNATLALPWVGWNKGKKIAASADFKLKQSKNTYTLENFVLKGAGFGAKGKLAFDKRGLIRADIKNLALNDGDSLRFKAVREKNVYKIEASGRSFDARGVMNTLIYDSTFKQAQGDRNVVITASFNQVKGFGNRILVNAGLNYRTRKGKLYFVDLTAQDEFGLNYEVQARRENNITNFAITSENAGNAFAFTDIYTRMEGGRLTSRLVQRDDGPYIGPVRVDKFVLLNEPRLARFASSVRNQTTDVNGRTNSIIPENVEKRARFNLAEGRIEKGRGYLNVTDAIMRNPSIGMTASGSIYDQKNRVNLNGTFMPANVVNSVISRIPVLGALLSGRDNPFIGITYRLRGNREKPELVVNPLSIVAPGVFKKVFEFKN